MDRCHACNGMITKNERVCFSCGDPILQENSGAGSLSALLMVGVVLALGITAWLYFDGLPQRSIAPSAAPVHRVSAARRG